jgi:electron transfer flavoprotein beta subunit
MNECDESALEEAVFLKKTYGGEITVLTMGGITTQEVLFAGLAKGADKAVRVDAQVQDSRAAATILAAALGKLEYDLVLTGTQSRDTLSGSVGIVAAEKLGIPFAYAVTKVEKEAGNSVKIRKELGGGRFADIRMPLPSLLCVQTGIQPLNYVPPARLLKARQQRPTSYSLADLGLAADVTTGSYAIDSVFPPVRVSKVEFLEGKPDQIAQTLLTKIREVV